MHSRTFSVSPSEFVQTANIFFRLSEHWNLFCLFCSQVKKNHGSSMFTSVCSKYLVKHVLQLLLYIRRQLIIIIITTFILCNIQGVQCIIHWNKTKSESARKKEDITKAYLWSSANYFTQITILVEKSQISLLWHVFGVAHHWTVNTNAKKISYKFSYHSDYVNLTLTMHEMMKNIKLVAWGCTQHTSPDWRSNPRHLHISYEIIV